MNSAASSGVSFMVSFYRERQNQREYREREREYRERFGAAGRARFKG
jgi:hypothetical protein